MQKISPDCRIYICLDICSTHTCIKTVKRWLASFPLGVSLKICSKSTRVGGKKNFCALWKGVVRNYFRSLGVIMTLPNKKNLSVSRWVLQKIFGSFDG